MTVKQKLDNKSAVIKTYSDPCGRGCLSITSDDAMIYWDFAGNVKKKPIGRFSGLKEANLAISWHPKNTWMVSVSPGRFPECTCIWNLENDNENMAFLDPSSTSYRIGGQFSNSGLKFVHLLDSSANIWDWPVDYSCDSSQLTLNKQFPGIWSIGKFSHNDSKIILLSSWNDDIYKQGNVNNLGRAAIFSVSTGELICNLPKNNDLTSFLAASSVEFASDDRTVAICFGKKFYHSLAPSELTN